MSEFHPEPGSFDEPRDEYGQDSQEKPEEDEDIEAEFGNFDAGDVVTYNGKKAVVLSVPRKEMDFDVAQADVMDVKINLVPIRFVDESFNPEHSQKYLRDFRDRPYMLVSEDDLKLEHRPRKRRDSDLN